MAGTSLSPPGARNTRWVVWCWSNGSFQATLRKRALSREATVSGSTVPGGSRSGMSYRVVSATSELISLRACSGSERKGAVRTALPGQAASSPRNCWFSDRSWWTHRVLATASTGGSPLGAGASSAAAARGRSAAAGSQRNALTSSSCAAPAVAAAAIPTALATEYGDQQKDRSAAGARLWCRAKVKSKCCITAAGLRSRWGARSAPSLPVRVRELEVFTPGWRKSPTGARGGALAGCRVGVGLTLGEQGNFPGSFRQESSLAGALGRSAQGLLDVGESHQSKLLRDVVGRLLRSR